METILGSIAGIGLGIYLVIIIILQAFLGFINGR